MFQVFIIKSKIIFSKDIEIFLSSYDSLIPLNQLPEEYENTPFEKNIKSMLIKNGTKTLNYFINKIKNDYSVGKLKQANGWIISETEFDLLMLKNMFKDIKDLLIDKDNSYDVCIVGSGPAGISVVKKLLNSKYKIALLESGGLYPEDDYQVLMKVKFWSKFSLIL